MSPTIPKKQPYTGDTDSTLTICPKKLRRHLGRDFTYVFIPTDQTDEHGKQLTAVAPMCKHCKQSPVKEEPQPVEP